MKSITDLISSSSSWKIFKFWKLEPPLHLTRYTLFLSLSLWLFLSLSLNLSLSLPLSLSISQPLSLYFSLSLTISFFLSLSISFFLSLSHSFTEFLKFLQNWWEDEERGEPIFGSITCTRTKMFVSDATQFSFLAGGQQSVRPDVRLKRSPISTKSCPKNSHSSFYTKSSVFKIAQKVTKYSGYFWKKICHREITKIAQTGHTGKQ